MATEKRLISVDDCPCDGCKAKPCGHPARCVKFTLWLNKTVDAVEVVHGRWEYVAKTKDAKSGYACSVCLGPVWHAPDVPRAFLYCPNCGAKMDQKA